MGAMQGIINGGFHGAKKCREENCLVFMELSVQTMLPSKVWHIQLSDTRCVWSDMVEWEPQID